MCGDKSTEKYRDRREASDDEENDDELDVKSYVKSERLSPFEQDVNMSDENSIKVLSGLHLTFNLEAGSLLPLAIKLVSKHAIFTRLLCVSYKILDLICKIVYKSLLHSKIVLHLGVLPTKVVKEWLERSDVYVYSNTN